MRLPVSVVVVRWRGGEEVGRCLASLDGAEQVVLVDNASGDGGAEELARTFPWVDVEALQTNRGFSGGVNYGVARTRAPLVLILNPDAALRKGALASLVAHLEEHPHAAGAVPALLDSQAFWDHRWQLKRLPRWVDLAVGRSGRPEFARPPQAPTPVPQPAAAAWLVRREVLDALDGLDESYHPAWWEDVDFCARLVAGGWSSFGPMEAVPSAAADHLGGVSVSSLGQSGFLTAYYRNLGRFAARHHPAECGRIIAVLRCSLWLRGILRPKLRAALAEAFREARSSIADPGAESGLRPR